MFGIVVFLLFFFFYIRIDLGPIKPIVNAEASLLVYLKKTIERWGFSRLKEDVKRFTKAHETEKKTCFRPILCSKLCGAFLFISHRPKKMKWEWFHLSSLGFPVDLDGVEEEEEDEDDRDKRSKDGEAEAETDDDDEEIEISEKRGT